MSYLLRNPTHCTPGVPSALFISYILNGAIFNRISATEFRRMGGTCRQRQVDFHATHHCRMGAQMNTRLIVANFHTSFSPLSISLIVVMIPILRFPSYCLRHSIVSPPTSHTPRAFNFTIAADTITR
jgi:hypothetical protein